MSVPEKLLKPYDPKATEPEIYSSWEKSGYFNPDNLPGERKETFSMVLPPPNATGTLHMGSALMLAVEDIMTRHVRMQGKKTLWIPGTDHAAIATQSRVEKIIEKEEGKRRHDLGREELLRRIEKFVEENRATMVRQMKGMGASLDWSREAFTLDEPRRKSVLEAFKQMHDAGLIYRGHRIVNWDPKGQTTISDDEIEYKEEKTTFYYLKYGPFVIGTARPETKFGDKYVVMHPNDARYSEYTNGQQIDLEWINGPITATVIKDESIDMEFGTGVMTITPWHSAIDFEIAERHKLDKEQIIDEYGKLLPIAGEFAGMKITEARAKIIEKLHSKGLVEKEEEYTHNIATAERTGGIIEPQIKLQWFIDVNKPIKERGDKSLKELMQEAVSVDGIKILPDRFEKTYFQWINNLRDWCISRQIWYGHRIPVWYCAGCGEIKVNPKIKSSWYFVRHGETDWNLEKRNQGRADIPLNNTGRMQAQMAADKLSGMPIDLIISSDLKRAAETAEIIRRNVGNPDIVFDKELQERDYGDGEGLFYHEMTEKHPDIQKYEYDAHGGESLRTVEERMWKAFSAHNSTHKDKNVVVVCHGSALRMLFKSLRRLTPEQAIARGSIMNAEIIKFDALDACMKCGGHFYEQDSDTLDTWFSSGLWTFSTLGWPEKTSDLATYHPTTIIESGYDIIFFWIARMILMSKFFLNEIPFKTIYLHGLVRDMKGQKISKSLGNNIDPLDMIAKYGADAVRMSLIIGTSPGADSRMSEEKIKAYKLFANKLWNIARFVSEQGQETSKPEITDIDQAHVTELNTLIAEVSKEMDEYKFYLVGEKLYHYVWHTFADKIIEESKPILAGTNEIARSSRLWLLNHTLRTSLKLLHPFMPFVTEELWSLVENIENKPEKMLIIAKWPKV